LQYLPGEREENHEYGDFEVSVSGQDLNPEVSAHETAVLPT
jgi:hypothetical protein